MENEYKQYGSGATIEKLDILSRYADAYTTALREKPRKDSPFTLHYVDAFAGNGYVQPHGSTESVPGSTLRALEITERQFDQLLFIDADPQKCRQLEEIIEERGDNHRAKVVCADANEEIPKFCSQLRGPSGGMDRAFIFVDPFAMQFSWQSAQEIAATQYADMLMLFPLMAVRRLLKTNDWPTADHAKALTTFFGDETWRDMYSQSGDRAVREGGDSAIVRCYAEKLESVFQQVVDPKRTLGSADDGSLFTMLFGASNPAGAEVAARIAKGVFTAATGTQSRMRLTE